MEPALTLTSLERPRGYYRTNITVGRPPLPGGWNTKDGNTTIPGQHCLDYYAVLYTDGDIASSSCLQIWPTWMYDLRYCNLYMFSEIETNDARSHLHSKSHFKIIFLCILRAYLNIYQDGKTFCKMFHKFVYTKKYIMWKFQKSKEN